MPDVLLLFFIVVAGLVVWGIFHGSQAAKKRRLLLQGFAERRGLSFEARENSRIDDRFKQFDCFDQGSNRYGYNHMRGTWNGLDTWCFDYHYETQSTDSKGRRQTHHHHSSNVLFEAGRPLHDLSIRSEGFFDRVAGIFGFDDIDFESAEFSRKFHVKSPIKRWAYDVISQKTMELLLDAPRFRIELRDRQILLRRDSRFTPADYDAALKLGKQVLDGIPSDAVYEQA